jgi:hypothetical protein
MHRECFRVEDLRHLEMLAGSVLTVQDKNRMPSCTLWPAGLATVQSTSVPYLKMLTLDIICPCHRLCYI